MVSSFAAREGGAQNVRIFSGAGGQQDYHVLLASSGGAWALSFDGIADHSIGWAGELELAQLPHADFFADGTPIPDCNEAGGIPICPVSELYARASSQPNQPSGVVGGRLDLAVELTSTASILVMDFDTAPVYAWGGDFSAIGATGVAFTVVYADPAAPNGWVKRALRHPDGTDAGPDGDGFFGFISDAPILKVQMRPRFLTQAGFGTEQFALDDLSGSSAPIPDPGAGAGTIAVRPASLTETLGQGQISSNQTFTVDNAGAGTLVYSISEDLFWLGILPSACAAPNSCLVPPGPDTLSVSFDARFLPPGVYQGTISVTSQGATNAPVDIPVELTVVGPPAVSLSADPPAIAAGGTTTLRWSAQNAGSCAALGGWSASAAVTGSATVAPTGTSIYMIECTGLGGSARATAQVSVIPPPAVILSANPPSIGVGGSSILAWSSSNATGCAATGGWSSSSAASGSQSVSPTQTTRYEIACTGIGGSTTTSATVTVVPAPTVTLIADPGSIVAGDSSTLAWSSSGANSCSAVGDWSASSATAGTDLVSPLETTAYTIICTGVGGIGLDTAAVSVTLLPSVANDLCPAAAPIEVSPFADSLDTRPATASPDDPTPACGLGVDGSTVWYAYTPEISGIATFTTDGSDYDTVISVWPNAEGCGGLATPLGCNDDGTAAPQSSLELPVQAGESYLVQVGDRDAGPGGQLAVQMVPEPGRRSLAFASLAALVVLGSARRQWRLVAAQNP